MAILKHVPSHNANYSSVIDYLTKEHDEKTGIALLNEYGEMIERDEYLIAGINCTPDNFAELCVKDCMRYNANRAASDIKTHQYILSFDPKDRENGLTLSAVQEEGLTFARHNFPGHRCIVCAHPDGKNGSENIHVHIVICSVRFEDRMPNPDFMKLNSDGSVKKSEYKAGYKHQDTARLRIHLNAQLQKYCRENGYTVSEQKPSKKITNKEYIAKKKGQEQLDKDNSARFNKGQTPAQTEFKTKKDDLRAAISYVVSESKNWDEFAYSLRNTLTRKVEQHPKQHLIPYVERKELWAKYKSINEEFWVHHKNQSEKLNNDITTGFKALRAYKELERKSKSYKNSMMTRIIASRDLTKYEDKRIIKNNISMSKKSQEQLRLHKNVYLAYAKAAKIALANNMKEEAANCLACMEELEKSQKGYWVDGMLSDSNQFDLTDLNNPKSLVTWMNTKKSDLVIAQNLLNRIQKRARELAASYEQPEIREEPFPIDVKISRGAISFKHPDLERWTRGKSLGAQFELEALSHIIKENERHFRDAHLTQSENKKEISQNLFENSKTRKSHEKER